MKKLAQVSVCAVGFCLTLTAFAQKPIVYPAKGQSTAQQSKDDGECYVWAKQTTSYDPANPQVQQTNTAATSQPAPPRGGLIKGAAAGAAVGAIGGNDVGNAAAKGAAVGVVAQHSRRRGQKDAAAQQANNEQQQQAQAQQSGVDAYQRAYSACMSGRGYTVN